MMLANNKYVHIGVPIMLALIINAFIYSSGWNEYKNATPKNPLIPPGYIIGSIWVLIFGFLGYAHYLLYAKNNTMTWGTVAIELAVAFCLAYPFLTNGLKQNKIAAYLNYATLLISGMLGFAVLNESKSAVVYTVPFIIWSAYVNFADVSSSLRSR